VSKITNDSLTRSGTGTHMATVGVKGLTAYSSCCRPWTSYRYATPSGRRRAICTGLEYWEPPVAEYINQYVDSYLQYTTDCISRSKLTGCLLCRMSSSLCKQTCYATISVFYTLSLQI